MQGRTTVRIGILCAHSSAMILLMTICNQNSLPLKWMTVLASNAFDIEIKKVLIDCEPGKRWVQKELEVNVCVIISGMARNLWLNVQIRNVVLDSIQYALVSQLIGGVIIKKVGNVTFVEKKQHLQHCQIWNKLKILCTNTFKSV